MTDKQLLEQALEALEYADEMIDTVCVPNTINAIRARLEQPEQEPVGKVGWAANVPNTIREVHWTDGCPPVGSNLYTTPRAAQRQWVWLTDEEMYFAIRPLYKTDALANAAVALSKDEYRAIEARHKEKNT